MRRYAILASLLLIAALLGSACVKKVTIPEALAVNPPLTTEELVNRLNSMGDVQTFAAQTMLHVRNYFTGSGTKAEDFPEADGLIRLQRPESIRMQIKAPVIGSMVADMVSDGHQFRIALFLPKDRKRFIRGSNLKSFEQLDEQEIQETKDPRLKEAGGLVNIRPQHLIDAFFVKATLVGDRINVFREESRQIEPDTRPGRRGRMVEKTYYTVYVVEMGDNGYGALRRKFWFDRTQPGTPLVRQQTFENNSGRVASDITYSEWFVLPDSNRSWPRRTEIDRRSDGYRFTLVLERDSVEFNTQLPETTFILENTEKLEEIDLDAPQKASASPVKK